MRIRLSRVHIGLGAVSVSAAVGQLTALLAAPVLSRLYSPEAFGAYALLLAAVTIAATVGSLRLESAIPLATAAESRVLLLIAALSAGIAGLGCAAVACWGIRLELGTTSWTVAFLTTYLVWVTAMYSVLSSVALRRKDYNSVARRNFLHQFGTAAGQMAASIGTSSAGGLACGLAVGRSVGVGAMLRGAGLLQPSGPLQIGSVLRRYWRFPCVFTPSALLNVLGLQLPIIVVTSRYGTESAGNLAQAATFAVAPSALLGSAVSSVVLAEMADRIRQGARHQRQRYLKVTRALVPVALAWLVGLVVLGPRLLPWLLGPGWTLSGEFAVALAVAAATGLVTAPLSVVLLLYEKGRANAILDIARVILVYAAGTAAWAAGLDAFGAVLAMSCAMGFVYVCTWFVGLRTVSCLP